MKNYLELTIDERKKMKLNNFFQGIVIAMFFVFLSGSLVFSYSSSSNTNRIEIKFDKLYEVEQSFGFSVPIETAEEAIQYAISLETVQSNLNDAISKGYDNWKAIGELSGTENAPFWTVKFLSKRYVPSFTCIVTFNKNGTLIDANDNVCGYLK